MVVSFTLRRPPWASFMAHICVCCAPFQAFDCMNIFRHVLLKFSVVLLALTPALACAAPTAAPIQMALVEGLSGPFANTGEAVFRNLLWATERINAQGGVSTPDGKTHLLKLSRHDSKGQSEEALSALRSAIDQGAQIILQGNSSAVAAALIDAIDKHNLRDPARRVLFLNYSAVEPSLTNERCSFWHFRFDAHADMRMAALMEVIAGEREIKSVYLLGQDYSFGQAVLRDARARLARTRPDVRIVGDELHPVGRIKDFLPYAAKIKASGAQAVITGNWGNDLTLLVKAAREAGFDGKFYTFYGNALGAPAAMGDAGIGRVLAVAEWLPNGASASGESFYRAFRQRFPDPRDDYMHMRMQWMVQALAQALAQAGSDDMAALARALEQSRIEVAGHAAHMRASDHQLQQALVVGLMERVAGSGLKFDVEGSGYGFRVIHRVTPSLAEQATQCRMQRP